MVKDIWPYWFRCCDYYFQKEVPFEINSNYFWASLAIGTEKNNNFKKLTREKDFFLFDDDDKNCQSVLTIGLDPENQFDVTARLKIFQKTIVLNIYELKQLLQYIDNYESSIFESSYEEFSERRWCISLKENRESRIFKLEICGKEINTDEKTLKKMLLMQTHIERYISVLQREAPSYERSFFTLLEHFYRERTIKEAISLSSDYDFVQCFFNDVIDAECLNINPDFLMDMASRFGKFFVKSLPHFINTLMLNESERQLTFSEDWPHSKDYISTKNMAMSGLYFNGVTDSVRCAFCPVGIHKWEPGDDPVADHYKYSRNCRLLRNPKETVNVLNLSSENELEDLLSRLPKRGGVDEVD